MLHLNLFINKPKTNVLLLDNCDVRTRAHDVPLFKTVKPSNEKYKRNVYYKGALSWNSLTIVERNQNDYTKI